MCEHKHQAPERYRSRKSLIPSPADYNYNYNYPKTTKSIPKLSEAYKILAVKILEETFKYSADSKHSPSDRFSSPTQIPIFIYLIKSLQKKKALFLGSLLKILNLPFYANSLFLRAITNNVIPKATNSTPNNI